MQSSLAPITARAFIWLRRLADSPWLTAVTFSLIGIFQLLTIRSGHDWWDDYSLYIAHAKNIVEGRPYGETGYVLNPLNSGISPLAYPPIYPLLLAPIVRIFGLDLTPMKVELVGLSLTALAVLFIWSSRFLEPRYATLSTALIGFNPAIWDLKDQLGSEVPFMLFTSACLLVVARSQERSVSTQRRTFAALITGILLYLAYGTRTIGLVLPACVLVIELLKFRRITSFSVLSLGLFFILRWIQGTMLPNPEAAYSRQMTSYPPALVDTIIENLDYVRTLSLVWDNSRFSAIRWALFGVASVLAVIGWWTRIIYRRSIFELFFVAYILAMMTWRTYQELRFLVPIVPLYIIYMVIGLRYLARQRRVPTWAPGLILLVVASSYFMNYTTTDLHAIPEGIGKAETIELIQFLKTATPPDALIVFKHPRTIALFASRRSTASDRVRDPADELEYLLTTGATHLVFRRYSDQDPITLGPLVAGYPGVFSLIFQNQDFQIYRIMQH